MLRIHVSDMELSRNIEIAHRRHANLKLGKILEYFYKEAIGM